MTAAGARSRRPSRPIERTSSNAQALAAALEPLVELVRSGAVDAEALEPFVELVRSGAVDAEALAAGLPELAGRWPAPELVSAGDVAARYSVSAEWVRDHRVKLGGIPLGDGPRPRWRFDLETVDAVMRARSSSERSRTAERPAKRGNPRRSRARATGTGDGLLPIRGERPA